MTERQDAWTQDHDDILAKKVLEHISNGSSQMKAFQEVGERLNRTPAACGFRWNSILRKNYKREIAKAKQDRLTKKVPSSRLNIEKLMEKESVRNHPLFAAIKVINRFMDGDATQPDQISKLMAIIEEKNNEINSLTNQLEAAKEENEKIKYRMDTNGVLERLG